jgi:hypothetical protein
MSFHDDGVTVAVGKASGDVAIYDLRSARGNKPLVVLPQAHNPAFAPTGVHSIHFQRVRRERSSRSTKSGTDASRKERSSASVLSESGTSVASSTGTAVATAAAAAERDASARSSLRSSAVSELSSTYTENPPDNVDSITVASAPDVAPPVFSPGPSASQHAAASGSPHVAAGSAVLPVSTPQSAARQQKTEAFQAKTNALLAKLDRMSPAGVQPQHPATEEHAVEYGGADESLTDAGPGDRNGALPELAPGLAQLRAKQKAEERLNGGTSDSPAGLEFHGPGTDRSTRAKVYQAAREVPQNQERSVEHQSRAARMSPPAATSAADTLSMPPSLTSTIGSDAVDARSATVSPAAQLAQAQRLQFSSSEKLSDSGSTIGAERVKTAWGSEEHKTVSAAASVPYRSGRDVGMHPNGSGIEPPAVLPTVSPESQSQHHHAPVDQDDGGAGPAPRYAQDAALQVRKTSAREPVHS